MQNIPHGLSPVGKKEGSALGKKNVGTADPPSVQSVLSEHWNFPLGRPWPLIPEEGIIDRL